MSSNRSLWARFSAHAPALLLLPLLSGHGLVVLGTCVFCALVLLISLLGRLYQAFSRKPSASSAYTVIVCVCVISYGVLAMHSARMEAGELAENFNSICNTTGRCELDPANWSKVAQEGLNYRSYCGRYAQFPVRYGATAQEFTLNLYLGPDAGLALRGGVGRSVAASPDE